MVCELLTGRTGKSCVRPRQLSCGQLDCLALLPFGIEDFNVEVSPISRNGRQIGLHREVFAGQVSESDVTADIVLRRLSAISGVEYRW
jgi:hypothetical protein